MFRKRFLPLCLAVTLLLCTMAVPSMAAESDVIAAAQADTNFNPTGYPIVKEKVTKTVMLRRPPNIGDPNTMATLQYIEELTNVHIEWVVVSSDGYLDRVTLAMASSELPDAIIKGGIEPNVITKFIADGSIIPLNGLIENYSTGIKDLYTQYPAVQKSVTAPDGNMYVVPTINTLEPNRTSHRNLWINKVWMEKLGLTMPTTTDEFLDVLRAFRDGDPNGNGQKDEIPYVVEDSGGLRLARPDIIASFFGAYSNMGYDCIQVQDGKVSFLKTEPVWKEVLQFMNIMWKEGLLDNEVFTQSPDASLAKFSNGNSGVFGLSSDDLFSTVSDQYAPLPPVKSSNGREPVIGLAPVSDGGFAGLITKADESPWITARWLDTFYTLQGSKIIGGLAPELEGVTCVQLEDGSYEYTDAILNDPRGTAVAVGEMCPLPGGGFNYWRNDQNSNYIYSKFVKDAVPAYQPYYQKDAAYGMPTFDVDTSQTVTDIRRDLDVYVKECQSKFITGEMSFDQWDEFVAMTQKLGANELVACFQAALDAQ